MGRDRAKTSARRPKRRGTSQTGPVVRGYQSKIDGSVQPYGIIVPAELHAGLTPLHFRLDLWWHGRGEKLTELNFLNGRLGDNNLFVPNGFVLHPYGRYCNANHFAGEIDTLRGGRACAQALSDRCQPHRRARLFDGRGGVLGLCGPLPGPVGGGATGGRLLRNAGVPSRLSEGNIKPNAWEKKLLHWYDCTDWAGNLFNVPTVAFSNEKESQRQAADIMAQAMLKEGLHLTHILAPGDAHRYPPPLKQKEEMFGRIDSIVGEGARSVAKARQVHDLHAALQLDALGDRRWPR